MNRLCSLIFVLAFPLVACSSLRTPLPLIEGPPPPALSSSVFAGYAETFRFVKEDWVRLPEYDYEFLLYERRFATHWEAVKEIHRRHPAYDGGAGPRDQTLYFIVQTSPAAGGGLDLAVEGTLGIGKGREDPGGRVILELALPKKPWFIPFDTIRITQAREATKSRIEETVDLFSKRNGREVPFMRMLEEGVVYRPLIP